jgi:hypothetical protein
MNDTRTPPTRRDMLRRWLRGKGYHPADIAIALAWYDAEASAGRKPTDQDVLAQCEFGHERAVGRYDEAPPQQLTIKHEHRMAWRLLLAAAAGGAFVRGLEWLVSALTR